MWLVFAFASALLGGLTAVLAKCGVRRTDSTVATALRTTVVSIFSWLMVWVVGSWPQIGRIGAGTLLFLALSGLATGASWLCYFRALQLGDVGKVVLVDKASVLVTLFLAFVFLREDVSPAKAAGALLIGMGTFLMLERPDVRKNPAEGRG